MNKSNIILDIDGVLADFVQGIINAASNHKNRALWNLPNSPADVDKWSFMPDELWEVVRKEHSFWSNLPVLNNANEKLTIIPQFYLTARPEMTWITEQWLFGNGFPKAMVKTVKNPLDKVKVMMDHPESILVDDHVETIEAVLEADRCGVLFKAPYQKNIRTDHLPVIETIEEVNLLGSAMKYREFRRQLNVESQTEKDNAGSEESGLARLA